LFSGLDLSYCEFDVTDRKIAQIKLRICMQADVTLQEKKSEQL
jgi:hypothetical protein